jgi:hypothetical protein
MLPAVRASLVPSLVERRIKKGDGLERIDLRSRHGGRGQVLHQIDLAVRAGLHPILEFITALGAEQPVLL